MSMRGFTLIEALIAVSILTIAVVGPMVTANRAIVASQTARDQLVASYLAQEAIEYVRAVRDNAFLTAYPAGDGWVGFISTIENNCSGSSRCTVDPWATMGFGVGYSMRTYSSGTTPPPLNIVGASSYPPPPSATGQMTYTQQAGTATPFTRTIQVFRANAGANVDERVVSTVSWAFHGTTYTVNITDHLTPWQ